jgi:hypothetical protein
MRTHFKFKEQSKPIWSLSGSIRSNLPNIRKPNTYLIINTFEIYCISVTLYWNIPPRNLVQTQACEYMKLSKARYKLDHYNHTLYSAWSAWYVLSYRAKLLLISSTEYRNADRGLHSWFPLGGGPHTHTRAHTQSLSSQWSLGRL